MSTGRPTPGNNTTGRASCLGGKHKKFKTFMERGDELRRINDKLKDTAEHQSSKKMQIKQKCRAEARQLQLETGMVDIDQERQPSSELSERKKHKRMLKDIFGDGEALVKMQGELAIFKSKEIMQQYYRRIVSTDEWTDNLSKVALWYYNTAIDSTVAVAIEKIADEISINGFKESNCTITSLSTA